MALEALQQSAALGARCGRVHAAVIEACIFVACDDAAVGERQRPTTGDVCDSTRGFREVCRRRVYEALECYDRACAGKPRETCASFELSIDRIGYLKRTVDTENETRIAPVR